MKVRDRASGSQARRAAAAPNRQANQRDIQTHPHPHIQRIRLKELQNGESISQLRAVSPMQFQILIFPNFRGLFRSSTLTILQDNCS